MEDIGNIIKEIQGRICANEQLKWKWIGYNSPQVSGKV